MYARRDGGHKALCPPVNAVNVRINLARQQQQLGAASAVIYLPGLFLAQLLSECPSMRRMLRRMLS
jgi:hypothetical protein